MINIERELNDFLKERNRKSMIDRDTWDDIIAFAWRYEKLIIKEKSIFYDELIDKVSSWWDEVYPAEYPDIIQAEIGDEGAVKVAEIRDLLSKIKALSERSRI